MSRSAYSAHPSAWPLTTVTALEPGEVVLQVAHLADLEVVAGDALVVADRDLAPEREHRLAERRVPGAAGTAEVLRRSGVVHRRRAAGRGDHGLAPPSAGPGMSKWTPSSSSMVRSISSWR